MVINFFMAVTHKAETPLNHILVNDTPCPYLCEANLPYR